MRARHLVPKLMAVAVLSTTLTILPAARADFLSDFYSEAGAAMNYTASGAYQTQAGNAYVGPSLSIRVPPRNLHPFAVTAPSVRASCSSIDMIAGSFGFVNETQLVNFIRNIGQAAPAYFFQLAMRSVAPEIAATLDVLNDLAQKMNTFGMNSCQALSTTFGSVFEQNDAETAQRAANWKVQMGESVDHFTGIFGVKPSFKERYETEQRRLTANQPGSKNADGVPVDPKGNFNIVWNSLRQLSGLDPSSATDLQYMRLIMSLTGTFVGTYDSTSAASDTLPTYRWVSNTNIDVAALLGEPTGPTTVELLECTDGLMACAVPVARPEVLTAGLLALVQRDLALIRDSILSRSIADPVAYQSALRVLGLTSVPAYRLIAASTRGSFSVMSDNMLNYLAEVVATDIAANYIGRAMNDLSKALSVNEKLTSGAAKEDLRRMTERIAEVRWQVRHQQEVVQRAAGNVTAFVQQVEHLERAFYANASTQIAANLRFGQR